MSKQASIPASAIKHCKGAGPKMAFAFDLHSTPGKVIVHTIQIDSHHLEADDFKNMRFDVLHNDNDERLTVLAQCLQS